MRFGNTHSLTHPIIAIFFSSYELSSVSYLTEKLF